MATFLPCSDISRPLAGSPRLSEPLDGESKGELAGRNVACLPPVGFMR